MTPDSSFPAMVTSPDGMLDTPDRPDSRSPSPGTNSPKRFISLEDYSERMRTAAVMLAQLNASLIPTVPEGGSSGGVMSWIPGTGWIMRSNSQNASQSGAEPPGTAAGGKLKLAAVQAAAIRKRIMEEMMALEEERVERMTERPEGVEIQVEPGQAGQTAEDEGIVRRELNKADPSGGSSAASSSDLGVAAVFKESWTAKKSRIRASSPWGHLANWDVRRSKLTKLTIADVLCDRQDRYRLAARATGHSAHRALQQNLQRGEERLLG